MPREGNEESWSPAERFVLREVIAERDRLKEQLDHVRDLSSRLIDANDMREARIHALETELRAKDALIRDLEAENEVLIGRLSTRESRISALESFLEMIAEAEKRE